MGLDLKWTSSGVVSVEDHVDYQNGDKQLIRQALSPDNRTQDALHQKQMPWLWEAKYKPLGVLSANRK
jgi:hypothetical protein